MGFCVAYTTGPSRVSWNMFNRAISSRPTGEAFVLSRYMFLENYHLVDFILAPVSDNVCSSAETKSPLAQLEAVEVMAGKRIHKRIPGKKRIHKTVTGI